MTLFDAGDKNAPRPDDSDKEIGPAEAVYSFGGLLLFFGGGSLLLKFFQWDFFIVAWVDNWGDGLGMLIRLAAIAVGIILMVVGKKPGA